MLGFIHAEREREKKTTLMMQLEIKEMGSEISTYIVQVSV